MKQITIADTIGALCSDDYKGINNQYIGQGKVVIIESICGSTIRWLGGSTESRTTTGFRWKYGGGTENIVSEEKACDIRNSKESDINGALQAGAKQNVNSNNVVRQQYAVRRLMPIECERLQGLPDNYTYLPGEKSCSDSARYKALGNGMAQPVADFVIRRIVEEVEKERTE